MNNTTVILSGETLFDVAIKRYGHMQGLAKLIADNGLSFTDEPTPGYVLELDESVSFDNLKTVIVAAQVTELSNESTIEAGQNIFDMALQIYGDLSGLVELSNDNGKALTDEVTAGEKVKSRNQLKNKLVVQYYQGKNLKPASGLSPAESEELKPEGIGYWAIEYDFEVS